MAVYTEVDVDTAAALLRTLDAGTLTAMDGCAGGIENTNYFVHSDKGDWVLTVFERLGFEQLPFYLGLMQHLARKGLPVPEPRTDASGNFLHSIAGKPASLVNLLPGQSIDAPMLAHCSLLGVTLAHLHTAALDFPLQQPNLRGLDWWAQTVPVVRPHVGAGARAAAGRGARLPAALPRRRQHAVAAARAGARRPVPRQRAVRRPARRAAPVRRVRLLLRRRRPPRLRPGRVRQRLVRRPRHRPPRARARRGAAARLSPASPDEPGRTARAARACAAPPRCASGCRGWPTGTCRARPRCSSPRIRRTSSACCVDCIEQPWHPAL